MALPEQPDMSIAPRLFDVPQRTNLLQDRVGRWTPLERSTGDLELAIEAYAAARKILRREGEARPAEVARRALLNALIVTRDIFAGRDSAWVFVSRDFNSLEEECWTCGPALIHSTYSSMERRAAQVCRLAPWKRCDRCVRAVRSEFSRCVANASKALRDAAPSTIAVTSIFPGLLRQPPFEVKVGTYEPTRIAREARKWDRGRDWAITARVAIGIGQAQVGQLIRTPARNAFSQGQISRIVSRQLANIAEQIAVFE